MEKDERGMTEKEWDKKLKIDKCIECGLCSYVCPSRIELTEKVGKAKDLYFKMSRK